MIPKEVGDYRSTGLVEVVLKVVTVILNHRLTISIALHGILNGFRVVCGTGTAYLEAKMLQQLTAMREEVLYAIFLDLHKVYVALDKYICLQILEGYGVGPWAYHIPRVY